MRVGIFETSHFEVAYPLIRLFDNTDNQLTIFTYQTAADQMKYLLRDSVDRYQWVIKPEGSSRRDFIQQIEKTVKQEKIDILFLNSVEDNFILYALMTKRLRSVRTILTIHDINNFFEYHYNGTFRRWLRNFGKKRLVKAIKEFTVISSTMQDNLQQKVPHGVVRTIPGGIFEEAGYTTPPALDQPFNIVVPGSVDERRRNYDEVFELLETCQERNISVKVTLLGGIAKPWGEKALEKAKAYAVKYSNLVFFEKELVDQEAFDRIMHGAHFIFSPIVAEILVSDGVTEKFGSSKATGNTGDIVRFARPSILPRHLLLPNELIESATCYTHIKEIPDQLQQIRDNPSIYSALREAAYNCSMQFRIAAIHNRYPELFKAGS